ncbi:Oidioi.mRNA.OKI2018_I69.PAR.g10339.t1.cds [Oikopleura dioica]|uniref:Oidioi.mRNA.OKI2018_I69.PAR.g10339.t1.cds n=1 Tax=Oikopleura dioica TaxID=34765 RepID=A0ABN7RTN6_OIKDI|nr:Oidioi.mRNA.OKI2018_I69.PAR.g10339.t1.cds [Oikopleura dioica]
MRGTILFFLIGSAFSFKYRLSETTGKFDDATRISLTQFLNENTSGPDLPENGRFTSQSIAVLQDFLLENGRLPINDKWDSLAIGTLQNYLLKLGYYDMKPCGMFGTGTLKSFKRYLRDQGFNMPITDAIDRSFVTGLNNFLHHRAGTLEVSTTNWGDETTEAIRKWLHKIRAKVRFTGEFWGDECKIGKWEWKTTATLQQYLNDHNPANLQITKRMNTSTVRELAKFLNNYHNV